MNALARVTAVALLLPVAGAHACDEAQLRRGAAVFGAAAPGIPAPASGSTGGSASGAPQRR